MLVLSRRTNETLVIDNNIRFTVLSVHGNQVRIGIEAPDDIIVLREEIIVGRDKNDAAEDFEYATENSSAPSLSSSQAHADAHGKVGRRGVIGLRRRRP